MKSNHCRSCGSEQLVLIHDFGPQPLAGNFPAVPNSQNIAERYLLDLTQCTNCTLLQVTNLPPIGAVFHGDYRYASSTVPDLVRHFVGYADFLGQQLPAGAKILEFGSNDGVLLAQLHALGFAALGVDASDNVAEMGRQKGLDIRTGFMTVDLVNREGLLGQFDLVTCSNVFAHIDEIGATAEAVRAALKPGGLFAIEVHDGELLAREAQFDTIYHEHLTYFTEASLRHFLEHHGFEFVSCARTPMHGGGLRFLARMTDAAPSFTAPASGLISRDAFGATIARCAADIRKLFNMHGPLQGYGAAGRSQMFINMTGAADCFERVFDDSPLRRGRYIVGTDIPIVPFTPEDKGEACVILAWNYAGSISRLIKDRFDTIATVLPGYREW